MLTKNCNGFVVQLFLSVGKRPVSSWNHFWFLLIWLWGPIIWVHVPVALQFKIHFFRQCMTDALFICTWFLKNQVWNFFKNHIGQNRFLSLIFLLISNKLRLHQFLGTTGGSPLMQISLLGLFKTITKILLMRFHGLFFLLLRTWNKNFANAIFG